MKLYTRILAVALTASVITSCSNAEKKDDHKSETKSYAAEDKFKLYEDDNRFADLRILSYEIEGFDKLTVEQKKLVYYLSQAALSGRDIIYDQNNPHNLKVRKTLEAIVNSYGGDKEADDWKKFMVYAKRVWFSNGIHHHYSRKKMRPECSSDYFAELIKGSSAEELPLNGEQTAEELVAELIPVIYDPEIDARNVNTDGDADVIAESANGYYSDNLTQKEVEDFYAAKKVEGDTTPISYGLNSKLVKTEDGTITEEVYSAEGLYGPAMTKMIYWLEKAITVAENDQQRECFTLLAEYFRTGDLKKFDEYNIAWVKDVHSTVDAILGFIEVYGDALGYRGAYESVVSIKDFEASERMQTVSGNAQYFEDNSPIMDEHKKKNVVGVSYKVIQVAMEAGDAAPSTPIGVNLPNANWIRATHGSKSVSLGNILQAYNNAGGSKSLEEFCYTEEEVARAKEHSKLGGKMHTALHEVIGHASGQIEKGVGTPKETLKNYSSTLEEGRADLVALYYIMDPKLVEMGLMPSLEVGKAEYDGYIRNGMMLQLRRLDLGENIEEAHMRNRQFVAQWAYEKGKADNVIEKKVENGKTYFVINDYDKLREIFGQLLREVQRIKSQGDFEAGKALVEGYGVKVDQDLHKEVLARYEALDVAPYSGFIQPKLVPVMEGEEIVDVKVEYPTDFVQQMLWFGKEYSFLSAN